MISPMGLLLTFFFIAQMPSLTNCFSESGLDLTVLSSGGLGFSLGTDFWPFLYLLLCKLLGFLVSSICFSDIPGSEYIIIIAAYIQGIIKRSR